MVLDDDHLQPVRQHRAADDLLEVRALRVERGGQGEGGSEERGQAAV
jgi:hypothetical protein